jgi:CheY-like chemotaxis protein
VKILIGEDERINQLYLRHLLSGAGHEVVLASDGREVLAEATSNRFDILLVDIHMPEMQGDEVVRRIRAGGSTATPTDVPVLAMTALLYNDDHDALIGSGFTDVIAKPFQDADLLARLDEYRKGES